MLIRSQFNRFGVDTEMTAETLTSFALLSSAINHHLIHFSVLLVGLLAALIGKTLYQIVKTNRQNQIVSSCGQMHVILYLLMCIHSSQQAYKHWE